jgi:hypothetical protein
MLAKMLAIMMLFKAASADNAFSCHAVNASLVNAFCSPYVKEPRACVDAGGFDYSRDEAGYKKQTLECSNELKRRKQCPNDPSECTEQVKQLR